MALTLQSSADGRRSSGTTRTARLLRPERFVRYEKPLNARDEDLALFANDIERTLPAVTLKELRDVHITPQGWLFQGWRLLPESFAFPYLRNQVRRRSRMKQLAINRVIRKERRFEERALWVTDTWSAGYFHWLTDVLSRLYMIRDLAAESVLLLPSAVQSFEWVAPTLQLFPLRHVEFVGMDEVLLCRTLTLPEHAAPSGHYDQDIIRTIRALIMARYGTASTIARSERVYLSRAAAFKRRIVNESAVMEALAARGFRIVQSERMPFREQVRLCSTADVLVSNHGAGMTNMLFLREGAKVLELRHETDAVNNCYFTLASAIGLKYWFQGCSPAHPTEDPHTADIIVDVDRLTGSLDSLLT